MVVQYARNECFSTRLLPPSTGQYSPVTARLAPKVAHQPLPTLDKGATDGRRPHARLRVALLIYIHTEFDFQGKQGTLYELDQYGPHARMVRERMTAFLGRLGLSPSPPVVARSLRRLEEAHLACFYPPPEERMRNTPKEGAFVTRFGNRVIEDNWRHYWPVQGIFEKLGLSKLAVDDLEANWGEIPSWAYPLLFRMLLDDLISRETA